MSRKNAREQLVWHVQRLERLTATKQEATTQLADGFKDAQHEGFDPATLKVVLKLRQMTPRQRRERRALEAIYMAALGMLEGEALPDEARRRLDGQPEQTKQPDQSAKDSKPSKSDSKAAGAKGPKATKEGADAPAPPTRETQPPLALKNPDEARKEGSDAAAAGKRIYDNPYPAGDPCRAAWDEGWCAQSKSYGMDTPAAYQRRSEKPESKDDPQKATKGAKKDTDKKRGDGDDDADASGDGADAGDRAGAPGGAA